MAYGVQPYRVTVTTYDVYPTPAPKIETPTVSNRIPPAKVALVIALFAAFVVATVFTGGAAAAAVAAGASAIYIGFLIGAAIALGISALASPFTASYCDMFKDTRTNGEDCAWFVGITSVFALYLLCKLGWEGVKTGICVECLRALAKK